jgi:hypothetical protein
MEAFRMSTLAKIHQFTLIIIASDKKFRINTKLKRETAISKIIRFAFEK